MIIPLLASYVHACGNPPIFSSGIAQAATSWGVQYGKPSFLKHVFIHCPSINVPSIVNSLLAS